MFKNKYPLQRRVFLYLILFTMAIFVFIWLFQIILFKNIYSYSKTREIKKVVTEVKNNYYNMDIDIITQLEDYAYDKGICSEIYQDNTLKYTTNRQNRTCFNYVYEKENLNEYKEKYINSSKDDFIYKITTKNTIILVYGLKIDYNTTIFSSVNIRPIDSMVEILGKQLIFITIITFIVAAILAYFIANKLSNPITLLTNKSKELSQGNFNIDFNVNSDLIEINELSDSLNYAKDILKKNDDIRRDLMANVSHDLKTPLTMIKAYAEMVRDLTYKNPTKRENDLNVIVDEVDRLNILVNDILSLSKLETNIDTVIKEEFDLVRLIATIIHRFKIFSLTHDFAFIYHAPKKLMVISDKQKMEQVIYNLISNAINYANDNKKIYITILPRKHIRVLISDTGPGIKKNDINKIWDKYYKADKNHKRNTIGTGLGLSIVKNIFELHSYKYGVVSKKNKGTTFYFEINEKKK